ncbi:MAG: hypothetical protein Fur0022_07440 [Anaerolineales bacterium]
MSPGFFTNSARLFAIAKQAYERAKAEVSHELSHESNEPLIAIIFSAAAVEAFINEIGVLASHSTSEPASNQIQNIGSLLSEIEDARGTTNLKYMVGKFVLTGKAFDKGKNPYQNFALLIELRNSIMHSKFDRIKSVRVNDVQIDRPPIIKKLPKKILGNFGGDRNPIANWLDLVSTPATAKWACNAASEIIKDMVEAIEAIPDSYLQQLINLYFNFNNTFSPIK